MAEVNFDALREGNSNVSKERREQEERDISEKRITTVRGGRSKTMREPFKKRFLNTFIDEDFTKDGLRKFVVRDIIVPAIQDAIMDSVNGALGMMFGIGIVRKGAFRTSSTGDGRIRYGGYFGGGSSKPVKSSSEREVVRAERSFFEVQMKDDKQKALDIMNDLELTLKEYGEVTVADYYDAFEISTEHTHNKYGWTDLSGMRLQRVSRAFYDEDKITGRRRYIDGWAVIMPPEHAL